MGGSIIHLAFAKRRVANEIQQEILSLSCFILAKNYHIIHYLHHDEGSSVNCLSEEGEIIFISIKAIILPLENRAPLYHA